MRALLLQRVEITADGGVGLRLWNATRGGSHAALGGVWSAHTQLAIPLRHMFDLTLRFDTASAAAFDATPLPGGNNGASEWSLSVGLRARFP